MPGASATRQRQESTSSNGSWQVVTDTGSIDSMMNGSYMMRFISQQQQDSNSLASCHSGNGLYGIGNGTNGSANNGSGNSYNCSNTPSNGSNNSGGSINGANAGVTNSINGKDIMPLTKPTSLL